MEDSYSQVQEEREQAGVNGDRFKSDKEERTDVHCHSCSKTFVALLDYSLEGNHVAVCPYCQHRHYRVIRKGKITEERWSGAYGAQETEQNANFARKVWKLSTDVIDRPEPVGRTSSASEFMRQRWIEKGCN